MGEVSMVFAGDVAVCREDAPSIFRHVKEFTAGADIGHCNLEGQICAGLEKNPAKTGQGLALRSYPNATEALLSAGFNNVSLANNHTMDFGAGGLRESIAALKGAGISYCGAGENTTEANLPVFVEKNGLTMAFISLTSVFPPAYAASATTPGAAVCRINTHYVPNPRTFTNPGCPMYVRTSGDPVDVEALMANIRSCKEKADLVFVAWHWGVSERLGIITEYQRTLGQAAIDAGADAVIGNHAHMMLGVEFYKDKPIFHALGNFGFDKKHPYFLDESAVVQCVATKDGLKDIRLVPTMNNAANEPMPIRTDSREGMKYQWMMEKLSDGLNTVFTPEGAHFRLTPASSSGQVVFDSKDAGSLEKLGYSAEQIEELRAAGALTS